MLSVRDGAGPLFDDEARRLAAKAPAENRSMPVRFTESVQGKLAFQRMVTG
jgi:hypothetical protein